MVFITVAPKDKDWPFHGIKLEIKKGSLEKPPQTLGSYMTYCLKNFMNNKKHTMFKKCLKNTMKIRKYFSIKDNENLAYSNLWDAANYV